MEAERRRLAEFLDQQLFRPVLDEGPEQYPPFRRAEFEQLREEIAGVRKRLLGLVSASALLLGFRESADRAASDLDERLGAFDLPTFGSIRDELEKLAAELAVPGRPIPASFPD